MLIKMPIFRNRGMSSAGAMPRDCAGAQLTSKDAPMPNRKLRLETLKATFLRVMFLPIHTLLMS